MIERIPGLEAMDCEGILDALKAIEEQAEKEAAALHEEIRKSYEERDKAAGRMHKAAESKDLKTYKAARMEFDMYVEYISKCEDRYAILTDGSLLASEDVGEIRAKMDGECFQAIRTAAAKIQEARQQMHMASAEALKEIGRRNVVLMKLHGCTRPKDQYGELKPPQLYRDTVIEPYLKSLDNFENYSGDSRAAAFKIFASAGTEAAGPATDPDKRGVKPGKTSIWNGNEWVTTA